MNLELLKTLRKGAMLLAAVAGLLWCVATFPIIERAVEIAAIIACSLVFIYACGWMVELFSKEDDKPNE